MEQKEFKYDGCMEIKKRICLIVTGIYMVFTLQAQRISVSEDLPFRSEDMYELLGLMGEHYLIYRNDGTSHEIIAFDKNMGLRWRKQIKLFGKRPELLSITKEGETINLITMERLKGISSLQLIRYDAAANLIDTIPVFEYEKRYYSPIPEVVFSEDHSHFVVYYLDRDEHIYAFAFNLDSYKVDWQSKIFMPGLLKDDFLSALVDNDANFYLVFDKGKRNAQIDKAHYLEILEINSENAEPLLVRIPIESYLTYDSRFVLDELNQQLVGGGFYAQETESRAKGYFYFSYKLHTGEEYLLDYREFSENLLSGLLGRQSKKSDVIENVNVGDIILRRDGGILLVGELNHFVERYAANPSRPYAYASALSISYFFDDLFVISIHPDGKFHWESIFYKKQYSQDDNGVYASYLLMKTPGSLRFLYNDEIKSENTVSEYVLKGDGKSWRNSVMNTKGQKIKLRFRDGLQISANELIVPSDNRGKLKLVRIEY